MPDDKIKILVTGFEPFSDAVNISGEVVKRLKKAYPNVELVTRVLPANYMQAETAMRNAIVTEKPDFVIALGEINDCGLPGMRVEKHATSRSNQLDKTEDAPSCRETNDQRLIRNDQPVLDRQLDKLYKQCMSSNDSILTSYDGGGYLCNDAYYTALKTQESLGKKGRVMFIHVNDLSLNSDEINSVMKNDTIAPLNCDSALDGLRAAKRAPAIAYYTDIVGDLITYIGAHQKSYLNGSSCKSETLPPPAPEKDVWATHSNMTFVPAQKIPAWQGPYFPVKNTSEVHPPMLPGIPYIKQRN